MEQSLLFWLFNGAVVLSVSLLTIYSATRQKGSGQYLCEDCRFNDARKCLKTERPNVIVCTSYRPIITDPGAPTTTATTATIAGVDAAETTTTSSSTTTKEAQAASETDPLPSITTKESAESLKTAALQPVSEIQGHTERT